MGITEIRAEREQIALAVGGAEAGQKFRVEARRPLQGETLAVFSGMEAAERGGVYSLRVPRFASGEDLLTAAFAVYAEETVGERKTPEANQAAETVKKTAVDGVSAQTEIAAARRIPGVCYVTKLCGVADCETPYPVFRTKKALAASGDDLAVLGIEQTLININLPALMTTGPQEQAEHRAAQQERTERQLMPQGQANGAEAVQSGGRETIPFTVNGRTFYFLKERVAKLDAYMEDMTKRGIAVTAILLNAPRLFDSTGEEALLRACIHPDFDWNEKNAFISAFSMKTKEGQAYYQAFVEFLTARYAAGEEKRQALRGMIVSNEVDSQYIWGNAGEKTPEAYMEEYAQTLRLTYLAGRKHYAGLRVYISLDHLFNISYDQAQYQRPQPLRFYKGRQMLELLNEYARRDGNFDWGVAYHPYPEDLAQPDFYNDRTASFAFSTQRITYKNIEMLPAYLAQERFLYEGRERRIILSEQGFNSRDDGVSEWQGAAGYVLAYQKVKKLPTVGMMTNHAYVDNRYEFGLHMGIRKLTDDDLPGEPRPIYDYMRDMGTEREQARVAEARRFIGEALFDQLLTPRILAADDLNAGSMEFQQEEKKQ